MRSLRSRLGAAALALAALPTLAAAQLDYSLGVDLERGVWSVEGRIANPERAPLDFWIARWTAGAYHLADYGRFVKELTAVDAEGAELAVERVDDSHWRIAAEGVDPVIVRYEAASLSKSTFSDNVIDVESNRIADGYAYVTPVSLFGFVPDREEEPFSLALHLPKGWSAATALEADEEGVYRAPSYWRFEDSPVFLSPDHRTLELQAAGRPLTVTVWGRDDEGATEVAEGCQRIVESAAQLMGGVPYTHYHFLIAFVPESMGGSGLEHSFSTLILVSEGARPEGIWSIVAHEFFHLWCAERIHVEAIHDPDYTRPLETATIWVNEGITEYFTQHVLLHAGLMSEEDLLQRVAGGEGLGPAGKLVEEVSWTDVSRDAQDWESMQELMLFAIKMYMQGPRTIFALDMEMRRASDGAHGVLDLLHHLDEEYVRRDRGFPEGGMVEILNQVSGGDLGEFHRRYIAGTEVPDPAEALAVIGYELVDGEVCPVEEPSPEQLRARADFFAIDGRPVPSE